MKRMIRMVSVSTLIGLTACGGGGGGGSSSSSSPAAPTTYSVTVTAGAGGTTSLSSATVVSGNTTTVTLTANTGYEIADVTGCGGTLSGNTFTTGPVTASCTITASFRLKKYPITATAGSGGVISPASVSVDHGTTTTLTATPAVGFEIADITGCNGTRNGNSFVTGPVTAACAVNATFRDIRITANGVVYERLDSAAYAPDYLPPTGISGATIKLRSGNGSTAANGTFAVKVEPIIKRDNDDLTADATGYASTSSPWNDGTKDSNQIIGMYKIPTITPHSGFVTGIVPHDVGGFYPDVYKAGLFPTTMQRGRDKAGANLVTLVDTINVTELSVPNAKVTMAGSPPWPDKYNPNLSAKDIYTDLTTNARSRGLSVMMMIQIYPDVPIISSYFAALPLMTKSATTFWDAWFAQLKLRVLERAAIARDLNMEYLVIGLNHYFMNQNAPYALWQDLVTSIRASGYKGKIGVFDGGFDGRQYTYDRADMLKFNSLFDFLGLSFYSIVQPQFSGEIRAREQTRARMRDDIKKVLDIHQTFGVSLMTLIGTPSVFGGVSNEEYIEPCLACTSVAPQRTRDLQQQADAYQAMYEVINSRPSGVGQVMGVLTWGYHYRDDPTTILTPNDSSYDKSASVRGKPAEAVMKHWAGAFSK